MLLDEFVANESISLTHRELYERACERLCHEVDKERLRRIRHLAGSGQIYRPQQLFRVATKLLR